MSRTTARATTPIPQKGTVPPRPVPQAQRRPREYLTPKEVERLISERTAARSRKDFKESDRIRDLLAAMGVAIKDSKDGTTWEVAR